MAILAHVGEGLKARYLVSLQYPEYRKLWVATVCSQSAAWALIVARAALVLQLTGSATWTGAVIFAAMIPSVLMSPVAGFLADRFDRRKVVAYAYGVNLAHNLLLSVLVVTGSVEAWQLLALAVVNGSARAVQMPASQALLPNTLPREWLFNAVALYGVTQHGSRFTGPFLILVLLWFTGHQDWVFFLCTALYCLGLGSILSIKVASTGVIQPGGGIPAILNSMLEGLRYIYSHPVVLSLVLLVVAHCALTMSFESLLPVLSRDRFGLENAGILGGFSYMMVGFGLAALVAAMTLAGVRTEAARGRLLLWLAVLSGVSLVALAMSPNLPLAILSSAAMGFSQGGFMMLSQAMVQSIVPDAIRGRVMAVYNWHILGFMAAFNMVHGALVEATALSASIILAAGGIAFLVVVALSFARVPLRQLYARGVPAT